MDIHMQICFFFLNFSLFGVHNYAFTCVCMLLNEYIFFLGYEPKCAGSFFCSCYLKFILLSH